MFWVLLQIVAFVAVTSATQQLGPIGMCPW